jgi:hypothetical protein
MVNKDKNNKEILERLNWLLGDIVESIIDNEDTSYVSKDLINGYSLVVYLKSGKSFIISGNEYCEYSLEIFDKPEEQDLLGR